MADLTTAARYTPDIVRDLRHARTTLAALAGGVLLVAACASAAQTVPEKVSRTPAQQKIDSQLLFEIYRKQGRAAEKLVPPGNTGVRIDRKGRALVDVRAEVTPVLQKKIRNLGGTIDATSIEYRSIVAWVPLLKLEQLAGESAVIAIIPKPEAAIR